MSRFFKSAAFPILIVIVLAFFASKLIANSDQAPQQWLYRCYPHDNLLPGEPFLAPRRGARSR